MKGILAFLLGAMAATGQPLPIRGIHLAAPMPDEMALAEHFIREALPKEGANTLVLEINYRYQFAKHPEVADANALSADDVKRLVDAARAAGVRLIPMINLLGHQSWARTTFGLLRGHPEFDETPGKYPDNQGTYCRSYCPLHPQVHEVVFDLIDELLAVTGADAFHVGMDEVFLIGEDACSRCKGRDRAALFAGEVRALHDHLTQSNRTMWMWGDRFIDGDVTGIGEWEAAKNGTAGAIHAVPKDIVICDWHYETAHATAAYFALEGFQVLSSPWRRVVGGAAAIGSDSAGADEFVAGSGGADARRAAHDVVRLRSVCEGVFWRGYEEQRQRDGVRGNVPGTLPRVAEAVGRRIP
jgi:hypothetical protein